MKERVVCKRLKGLMVENELTLQALAEMIGISENSLTQKINGHREFWYWEMVAISKVFRDNLENVFPELVSKSA